MNPFTVLNVDEYATQKDIVQAVARAMREKKYSAAEIAVAQKTLLDPVSKGCAVFLHRIDLGEEKKMFAFCDHNGESPTNGQCNCRHKGDAQGKCDCEDHGYDPVEPNDLEYLELFVSSL
ncbi:MAG: hypothetical protein HQK66_06140 [Desulfamplus sp.]|nr:hypothetical protein [Desulfamplus sp.]